VRRVVVIGTSGSGKTTLAMRLASVLGVPHFEMDSLYHRPNWTHVDDEELARQVASAAARPGWVMDGNYSRVRGIAWAPADTIVWLDYPKWLVMVRVVRRSVHRAATKRELWHGNTERFRNLIKLDRDENIVLWAWTTHGQTRARYEEAFAADEWSSKSLIRLRSPREARRFLDDAVGSG